MNPPSVKQPSAIALPWDAEQVQHLPYEQMQYVLPGNTQRLFPIHVFVGSDMHRESVTQWYECVLATYLKCADAALYVLHDLRNPQVHFSAYSIALVRSLIKVRADLKGGSAIVLPTKDTIFLSLLKQLLQDQQSPRSSCTFSDYEAAVHWLCGLMHK